MNSSAPSTLLKPAGRSQSMPHSDNIWGRRTSILPSLGLRKPSEVGIVLDGPNESIHSYSTFDEITGHVDLKFEKDTCIEEFAITFLGQTNTWVEKLASTSPTLGRMTGSHTFLRVHQPIDGNCLPEFNKAIAGETYTIPFKFVVPDRILDFACNHKCDSDAIKDCHLQLPPSVGDATLAGQGNTLMDDLAPSVSKIGYLIRVGLLKICPITRKLELTEEQVKIRVIPVREEMPPLLVNHMTNDHRGQYCLRKERNVRKGLFNLGRKTGCLLAESFQPPSLKLPHPSTNTGEAVKTIATVQLRYDPVSIDEEPPSLSNITNKLKVWTFFGVAPWTYFATPDSYDTWSTMHSQYPESVELPTHDMSNVEWKKHEPSYSSTFEPTATSIPIPNAHEKRTSKSLSMSIPSSYGAGSFNLHSTADNPLSRRPSTSSDVSSTSTLSTNDSDSTSSSTTHSETPSGHTLPYDSVIPAPSTSYHYSLPYYTASIIIPVTLPTTSPSSLPSFSRSPTFPFTSALTSALASTTTSAIRSAQESTYQPPELSNSPPSSLSRSKPKPQSKSKLITFLPTFHSCLVARIYTLELSVHAQSAPTINLKVPIQISLPYANNPNLTNNPNSTIVSGQNSAPFARFDPFSTSTPKPTSTLTSIHTTIARTQDRPHQRQQQHHHHHQQILPDVPEYEFHDPQSPIQSTRHMSLSLPSHTRPRPTEDPPEYHSTVRKVSIARRASVANAGDINNNNSHGGSSRGAESRRASGGGNGDGDGTQDGQGDGKRRFSLFSQRK